MGIISEFKTFVMRGNVIDLAVGVIIGGAFGYHFVGDYFAYTNDASVVNDVKNSFLLSLRASLEF